MATFSHTSGVSDVSQPTWSHTTGTSDISQPTWSQSFQEVAAAWKSTEMMQFGFLFWEGIDMIGKKKWLTLTRMPLVSRLNSLASGKI